jgi:hypothetical protein
MREGRNCVYDKNTGYEIYKTHTYLRGKTDPWSSVTYEYPPYPLGYSHTLSEVRIKFTHFVLYIHIRLYKCIFKQIFKVLFIKILLSLSKSHGQHDPECLIWSKILSHCTLAQVIQAFLLIV